MKYCMDHPEEVSKLAKVKAQVSEVKGIMMENIDKAIDRGQQIDVLVSRTEQLHDQAGISVSFIKALCWLDRPRLGEQMKYCMDHPEEVSKLAKVKAQVSEVKGIMMENIDKAADFRQQGTRVRRKMWYQNMKIKLIVLGIIIALILIIILSVCHGFKC
ncbi:hypothetical protein OsJ_37022 [Oryza sativa Japonica Group]|uniref:V-SNARE coiled-coil homology domain-containing protein n=1 Tax=Oryza sativa subsp. japonica TaxID=39947 RepID=A3CJV2_ORYSJ|nr:hypothetical protein OsJ_37022 [Oryza sativa Japonica Group]